MSYNPNPSRREIAISEILRDVFGEDPEYTQDRLLHYDVDASMLDMMLEANPEEDHLLDFFEIQSRDADLTRIREATRRILLLSGELEHFWHLGDNSP
jgi:hypothetical protein